MGKIITHSDNPNKSIRNPRHHKTWQCRCGTINEPEAVECKMILMLMKNPDLAKSLRGARQHSIPGERRHQRREGKEASAKIKAQVAEIDAWLLSPSID